MLVFADVEDAMCFHGLLDPDSYSFGVVAKKKQLRRSVSVSKGLSARFEKSESEGVPR